MPTNTQTEPYPSQESFRQARLQSWLSNPALDIQGRLLGGIGGTAQPQPSQQPHKRAKGKRGKKA
ncbi:hypothetical protein QQZ08_002957 [Neonectria magnoliae]|uniref:Uncharacterized protein n=1 Tax=Neonectria magnoliae TaxID=2732573 RepID=A0ABR1IA11_9HYPO